MKLTRTYKLKLYPNFGKSEVARYSYKRFLEYTNLFAGKLFFNGNKSISTEGLGKLANQAQHKARGITSALVAAAKQTGRKTNVPSIKTIGCPAKIQPSKTKKFNYWVSVENQFSKGRISMPALSHKKLNVSLRQGWMLNSACEFIYENNKPFARVFVQKEVSKAQPQHKLLGCDVGYKNSVTRSDKYIGRNASKVIFKSGRKQASRQRQGIKTKSVKSQVKQLLDVEAKSAVARCKKTSSSLAVESPKVLNNLRSGRLQGWARNYFANRCHVLGSEEGVFVWEVNPAYTSQTCSKCGHVDKQSRCGTKFCCTSCGFEAHADVNAACNIATKGMVSLGRVLSKRSGTKISW